MDIKIREARPDDAPFVAWAVLTALDLDESALDRFSRSCADEKSLYSWKNALIAEADGKPAGCIVAYPGDVYDTARRYTWPRIWADGSSATGRKHPDIDSIEPETQPGEFYLDTLAVIPAFRGAGIGRLLIGSAMRRGRDAGYRRFSLIADIHKSGLLNYYAQIGFSTVGEIDFFGHRYYRMQKNLPV